MGKSSPHRWRGLGGGLPSLHSGFFSHGMEGGKRGREGERERERIGGAGTAPFFREGFPGHDKGT